MRVPNNTLWIAAAAALYCTLPKIGFAAADVMVYPSRVVMTDRERTAQVDVVNTGSSQAVYKISLVRKRMTDTGEFSEVVTPDPEEKFADDLVKYSPRQVTLLPGASQTVRMMFKAPPALAEGEYRSHIVFTKMPQAASSIGTKDEAEGVSMRININVGISIPLIVRHGKLQATAKIEPSSVQVLAVEPKQQSVSFILQREGTRSIYGDATLYRGGEKVAETKGLAVYTPNKLRKIALPVAEHLRLKTGDPLKISFVERDGNTPLAEVQTVMP